MQRRPLLAALLTAALTVLPAAAGTAEVAFENAERIAAPSARATAIQISQRLYPDGGAGAVVLARENAFPDALGAASLTADLDAPLLLTPTDTLPAAVENEIDRLVGDGGDVYLLGGTAALSAGLERRLDDLGYRTSRFPGRDRVETAAMVARFVGSGPGDTALLVRASGNPDAAQGWVDSVSCGAWAADTGTPVLLTHSTSDTVADQTVSALDQLGVRSVAVCGGTAAVPASQLRQLRDRGLSVTRYAGEDRIATAVDVATRLWDVDARAGRSFLIAPGYGTEFGYGLVAAPLAAAYDAPLLLVADDAPTSCDGPAGGTLCYLEQIGPGAAERVVAVGGTGVIADAVFAAAARAAGLQRDTTPPPVPTAVEATDVPEDDGTAIAVTWQGSDDATSYTVRARPDGGDAVTVTTAETEATVTGLTAGTTYDVTVVAADEFDNRSSASATVQVTPEDEVPAAPPADAAPTATAAGDDVVIGWVAAPEADVAGYVVERTAQAGPLLGDTDCVSDSFVDPAPDWSSATRIEVSGADTTEVVDAGQADTDWCYRYRVVDDSGNETDPSGAVEYDAP